MRQAILALTLAFTAGTSAAAFALPADQAKDASPGVLAQLPPPVMIAQAAPLESVGSGLFYNTMEFTPFVYLKTDALTQQRSLARGVWGGTYEYNHFAIGSSFQLVLQYQGQYFHYFSVASERAFYHRGALHMMKQFGDYNWHLGGQALFKHPAFNIGTSNLDQLYYTVVERPIGLFGFNLLNVGFSFDYFRSGMAGNSYYAPGLVFGYSPPLGDIMNTGFGYRLQYRVATDGGISGLRHTVGLSFAPNVLPVLPLNVNLGIEAQQGQPISFFLSTGVGFAPTIALQKAEKPLVPAEQGQAPVQNQVAPERLKTLANPAIQPANPLAPGSSAVDPGSSTGRGVDVILH